MGHGSLDQERWKRTRPVRAEVRSWRGQLYFNDGRVAIDLPGHRGSVAMNITASRFYSLDPSQCGEVEETGFFRHLKMENRTFKLTLGTRFAEIERSFGRHFAERGCDIRAALDVGVSSGVTTAEFADFLAAHGSNARWIGTDLYIDAHIVAIAPGLRILAAPNGWPLQYDIGGLAVRPWIRRLDYVTLAFIPRILARAVLRRRAAALIGSGHSEPVQLISPRVTGRKDIRFLENDIMKHETSFEDRFDLVRAANILNRNYFPVEKLERAIANVRSYLRGPGALFLVTRTSPALENAGTLFELAADGTFRVVDRIGGGSEIEDLVLCSRPHELDVQAR